MGVDCEKSTPLGGHHFYPHLVKWIRVLTCAPNSRSGGWTLTCAGEFTEAYKLAGDGCGMALLYDHRSNWCDGHSGNDENAPAIIY